MTIEDNESELEILKSRNPPTEKENKESHNHHGDNGEKDNKNINQTDSHVGRKKHR